MQEANTPMRRTAEERGVHFEMNLIARRNRRHIEPHFEKPLS